MSEKKCHVCSRDISKPSLVRCQATACPLNKPKAAASRQTLIGIVGIGVGIIAAIALVSGLMGGSGGLGGSGVGRPSVASQFTRSNVNNWLDGLWKPRVPDVSVNQPRSDGSDWGAATRVETFSCEGRLSAARSVICSHWDLATVDYNLALVYRQALGKSRDPAALRAQQDRWLARLDALDATPDMVMAHYRARLDQLQSPSATLAAQ